MRLLRRHVEARARERGHDLASIEPCFVSQYDDGWWEVDVDHPAYPRTPKPGFVKQQPAPARGPGTELKKLLSRIGITATPNCSCNARARKMDEEEAKEPGWCAAHLDEIVGWLREEATKRKLPFLDAAGRVLVRRAISNARREQARAEKAVTAEGQAS